MLKTWIMVPTYNESDNIPELLKQIMALNVPGHEIHVLIVDDNSPDGTSQTVQKLLNQHVHLMTRMQTRGRGSAGIDGFKECLKNGADYIIEMDADFSHDPKYIPSLMQAADQGADIVIGSRFVDGGSDDDRGLIRKTVTQCAGIYVRLLLKLDVRDVSSGYRCFKRKVLESIRLDKLISTGPSIVLEILFKAVETGFKVKEVPIVFIDRKIGTTKLNFKILLHTLYMVKQFHGLKARGELLTLR